MRWKICIWNSRLDLAMFAKKTNLSLQPPFNGHKWDVITYFPSTWGCKKWQFLPSNYGATSPKTKYYGNHGNPVTMITYMWLHHPLSHNISTLSIRNVGIGAGENHEKSGYLASQPIFKMHTSWLQGKGVTAVPTCLVTHIMMLYYIILCLNLS